MFWIVKTVIAVVFTLLQPTFNDCNYRFVIIGMWTSGDSDQPMGTTQVMGVIQIDGRKINPGETFFIAFFAWKKSNTSITGMILHFSC